MAAGDALSAPSLTTEERDELVRLSSQEGERLSRAGREPARPLAAAGRPRRAAARLVLARGGAARGARRAAASRRRRSGSSVDPDLPLVRADAAQLERAFANLLENAARYSGGQPVSVRGPRGGTRVLVRIVDQGPGIDPAERERIFEPFYRGRRAAATVGRLGPGPRDRQGLRRGQRRHDLGRVAARSGHELRGLAAARGAGRRRVRRERCRRDPGCWSCDDEPQILRALRVILRDAGFEALPATTAEEALDVAAVRPPDAAIVDLVLPDVDGIELCRRLREWTEMPMIVLSAVGEEDAKVRALAAGADDYVTKPFGPRELVARLQANLRRVGARARGGGDHAPTGSTSISPAARCSVDGEEVHLTPIEFDLLRRSPATAGG